MSEKKPHGEKTQLLMGEESLLLDHDYDGIQELDHPLPLWWRWLFYITIVFSIAYAFYYMTGVGPTLSQELEIAMTEIEALRAQQQASGAGGDGFSNKALLALISQPEKVESGKVVYAGKCAACHGDKGQGIIGPNLTDDHWLHGTGQPAEIAATIRDGVAEKGMPPWGPILTPDELANVTAFIKTLRGTNPPGAKEPQGSLHVSSR